MSGITSLDPCGHVGADGWVMDVGSAGDMSQVSDNMESKCVTHGVWNLISNQGSIWMIATCQYRDRE